MKLATVESWVEPATSAMQKKIDRKSTRLNSSHSQISYAVFCLKKKNHIIAVIQSKCLVASKFLHMCASNLAQHPASTCRCNSQYSPTPYQIIVSVSHAVDLTTS